MSPRLPSTRSMPEILAPFLRQGQPIPLTQADYANRGRVDEGRAKDILSDLVSKRLVIAKYRKEWEGLSEYRLSKGGAYIAQQKKAPTPPVETAEMVVGNAEESPVKKCLALMFSRNMKQGALVDHLSDIMREAMIKTAPPRKTGKGF